MIITRTIVFTTASPFADVDSIVNHFTNVISKNIFIIPRVVFIAVDLRPILLKYRYVEVFVFFNAVAVVIAVTTAVTNDVAVTGAITITVAVAVTVAVDDTISVTLTVTFTGTITITVPVTVDNAPTTSTTTATSTNTTTTYDTTDLILTKIINFPTVSDIF